MLTRRSLLLASGTLAGCSRSRSVIIASKNFTEQVILGEIIAQQVERRLGGKADRKLNLGGTLLAHQSLIKGEIDLYPEYTGTALINVLKLPPSADPAAVLSAVREQYRSRWSVEWLDPLGFNNTFAMAIRGEDARRYGIETLSDAAGRKDAWKLGVGYEFLQRADGLAGLVKTYSLRWKQSPTSMDLGLLYKAIEGGQVDMIAANATDGMLAITDLKVLRDDRGYFPPYQACILVRAASLTAFPGLREPLAELSGKLSDTIMRKLNYQVDGEKKQVAQVAREFLVGLA